MTGLYIFLAIKVNSILNYYNNFISGTASKLDARGYIDSYYVIVVIISIIICLIIYALMRYKKKPRLLYLILIGFSIIIAIMINYSYQGLDTIYISILDSKSLLLYRDLLRILVVFQYLSIFFVLVRGLGFDIKKFNFVEDLVDLGIDVSDEEEVELSLGNNQFIVRKFHRNMRELKYYYLENKNFILIIIVLILVVSVGAFTFKKEVVDKVYQQNEIFVTDNFRMLVVDSFITNKSFDNKEILKNNKSFVVVKVNLVSNGEKKEFNTGNLILKVGNESYASEIRYVAKFSDLGTPYRGEKIGGASSYLFIYQVENSNLEADMKLIYANDKTVKLNPVWLDNDSNVKEYKLGEVIDLSKTSLGSGSFKVNSFEFNEKFSYPYQYEIDGQLYTSQLTITSVNNIIMNLKIESTLYRELDNYSFLANYAKLKYIKDAVEYDIKYFDDKTPGNYREGLYIGVDKEIKDATNIWFEIKIRNKSYKYILK